MSSSRPISGSFVLLDANVLYPVRVCDFILTASSLGLLGRPVVSAEILDEAYRNILTDRPDLDSSRIDRRFDAVRAATDGHDRPIAKRFVDRTIVNHKDRADELASRLAAEDIDAVARVVEEMASRFREPRRSAAEVLSALRKSLPSLPT